MAEGFSQVALPISLADAGVDRLVKIPAHQVDVLAHLGKDHGQTAVLAQGNALLFGDAGVFQ